jgi:hypothetical protein
LFELKVQNGKQNLQMEIGKAHAEVSEEIKSLKR